MMSSRPDPADLANLWRLFNEWEADVCFGGSKGGNTQAPPPAVPNTYQEVTSQAQRNQNQMVAMAQKDTVNSATSNQINPPAAGTFGAELGQSAMQGGM